MCDDGLLDCDLRHGIILVNSNCQPIGGKGDKCAFEFASSAVPSSVPAALH